MIIFKELNPHGYPTDQETHDNLEELLAKMNIVRASFDKPMTVTSGLRSEGQQQALIDAGKSTATKSRHLTGQACDIADKDGEVWKWCMIHMQLLVDIGLWLEDKKSTPTWVHFQSVPPKSGKRIFIP